MEMQQETEMKLSIVRVIRIMEKSIIRRFIT